MTHLWLILLLLQFYHPSMQETCLIWKKKLKYQTKKEKDDAEEFK